MLFLYMLKTKRMVHAEASSEWCMLSRMSGTHCQKSPASIATTDIIAIMLVLLAEDTDTEAARTDSMFRKPAPPNLLTRYALVSLVD